MVEQGIDLLEGFGGLVVELVAAVVVKLLIDADADVEWNL